jgi:hypothetical protein
MKVQIEPLQLSYFEPPSNLLNLQNLPKTFLEPKRFGKLHWQMAMVVALDCPTIALSPFVQILLLQCQLTTFLPL